MNYYERFIKCRDCSQELRLTTLWRPNRTGLQMEAAWIREFEIEHSQAKHKLVMEQTSWRKGQ